MPIFGTVLIGAIKKYYLFFITNFIVFFVYGQLPQEQVLMARITKEVWGGVSLHSQGFGVNLTSAKFKTFKTKRLFNVDILGIKHEKEYKIFGSLDENAKRYVFGKLNSLYAVRIGFGYRKVIYEKFRHKGIQIARNWSFGPSIGWSKPVYLEVFKIDPSGNVVGVATEKYNPERHNIYNIYGRGPWASGIGESQFYAGLYIKMGLEFEYGTEREAINALELGFALDAFRNKITIMTDIDSKRLYPSVYMNFSIGTKYY